jgi:hypothetical protein
MKGRENTLERSTIAYNKLPFFNFFLWPLKRYREKKKELTICPASPLVYSSVFTFFIFFLSINLFLF